MTTVPEYVFDGEKWRTQTTSKRTSVRVQALTVATSPSTTTFPASSLYPNG